MVQKTAPCQYPSAKMGIGERLKEERVRLGLSQTDFAAIGRASKRSQIVWESDKDDAAVPNAAFLAAVAAVGVDVAYVVTGVRTVSAQDALPPRERALIDSYRNTDQEGQRSLQRQALLEAERATSKRLASEGSLKTADKQAVVSHQFIEAKQSLKKAA